MTPEELRERLEAFAAQVDAFAEPLLKFPVTQNSGRQLIRASSSAAQNHRAAGRARSHAEFAAKIGTALEEADEALGWTQHLVRCKRVRPDVAAPILDEADQLVRILKTSHATARRNEEEEKERKRAVRRRKR